MFEDQTTRFAIQELLISIWKRAFQKTVHCSLILRHKNLTGCIQAHPEGAAALNVECESRSDLPWRLRSRDRPDRNQSRRSLRERRNLGRSPTHDDLVGPLSQLRR